MFHLRSNQYIPLNGKRLPNGFVGAITYYYFVNDKEQKIDKVTLKPYRGKNFNKYAMISKTEAEAYLEVINQQFKQQ